MKLTVDLPTDSYNELKVLALVQRRSMRDVLIDLIRQARNDHGADIEAFLLRMKGGQL